MSGKTCIERSYESRKDQNETLDELGGYNYAYNNIHKRETSNRSILHYEDQIKYSRNLFVRCIVESRCQHETQKLMIPN